MLPPSDHSVAYRKRARRRARSSEVQQPRAVSLIIDERAKGGSATVGQELFSLLFGDEEEEDDEAHVNDELRDAGGWKENGGLKDNVHQEESGGYGSSQLKESKRHSLQEIQEVVAARDESKDLGTSQSHNTRHIAVAPWFPPSAHTLENSAWTIFPVRLDSKSTAAHISIPATALGLQSFGAALRASRGDARTKSGFDVLAVEVEPLELEEVFVKVDGEALRKHEEVQRKFGGGFLASGRPSSSGKGKSKVQAPSLDNGVEHALKGDLHDRLTHAVHTALGQATLVHVNDQLQIPLPAHPITHTAFPPVEIIICSPVNQGRIGPSTKVVVDLETPRGHRYHHPPAPPRVENLSRFIAEEDEDTTNDSFFSAAESGPTDSATSDDDPELNSSDGPSSPSEDLESSDDGEISEDSGDELISLNSSMLPSTSGIMSTRTAATPRPFGLRQPSGAQSPKSVYSSYTVTTARPGGLNGRSFQLHALYNKVADALLHPRPIGSEDDEARVFVDIKMLTRLGCFSGDWVKLSLTSSNAAYRSWSFNDLEADDGPEEFRVVKVYGLPDIPSHDAMQYAKSGHNRRLSQTSIVPMSRPAPNAYVSPILFSNLGQPSTITLSALSLTSHDGKRFFRSKLINSAAPPLAKEVTLLRLPTPLSTERSVQPALLASLKQYFESRRRLIRSGDLVAIRFQPQVSRVLFDASETTSDGEPSVLEEFLAATSNGSESCSTLGDVSVAWFRIGQVTSADVDREDPLNDRDLWGGMASIEPLVTKMVQVGRSPGRVPALLDNPWPFYFGQRPFPRTLLSAPTSISNTHATVPAYIRPVRRQLREILAAATSPQAKRLGLGPSLILLHSTQRRIGKTSLTTTACADLGLHVFPIDTYDILSEGATGGDVKTEATLRARVERGLDCGTDVVVPLIQHMEALTADRTAATIQDLLDDLRALVMTTTEIEKIPDNVRSLVTHEIEVSAPDEGEREGILRDIVNDNGLVLSFDVELTSVALRTAALVAGDLLDVVERATVARQVRLEQLSAAHGDVPISNILIAGGQTARCLNRSDFDIAVEATRKNFADSIGAPKIPNVRWADVGGLAQAQAALRETIQLPLERPELFARGARKRSGVLLYGPPGTGKTLLAKAVATEFSLNFFSVKGPELLNMYIGESEANVRRVFARARDARPCVVFFDELDAVAPRRGNQGDSGGVMDRIVSQLLAELDGMSSGGGSDAGSDGSGAGGGGGGVFVIGATNRPDLLDPALLRPGRFDKMLYLGVPDTHASQQTVLEALTRKFSLSDELDLGRVAESLPLTYTGADMYALCADAMLKAIMRRAATVDAKIRALEVREGKSRGEISAAWYFDHISAPEDTEVKVTAVDFEEAKQELVASVSADELAHYQRVRAAFEGQSLVQTKPAPAPDLPRTLVSSTGADTSSGTAYSTTNSTAPSISEPTTPPNPGRNPALGSVFKEKAEPHSHPTNMMVKNKGKGKLRQMPPGAFDDGLLAPGMETGNSPDDEEDDDEAYVTSYDFGTPERVANGHSSGGSKGKGKQKEVLMDEGFRDPTLDDEAGLYE